MASEAPKTVSYKLKWILRNVTRENIKIHDINSLLETQVFQTRLDKCLIEWFLDFHHDVKEQSVSLFFHKKRADDSFLLNLRVGMLNQFEKTFYENDLYWGWSRLIKLDKLLDATNKYIDDEGSLTLDIEVKFTEIILKNNDEMSIDSTPADLYSKFFNTKMLSDFTFKCSDDIELPVHQIVLAANSEVFLKMFTTEMDEKKSNAAVFSDISSETMKTVLEYIYTKEISFSDVESTIKILYVGEKYELPELKQRCIDELMKNIDKENVLEIFETADLYNVLLLEQKCLSIITENYKDIKCTEKYSTLEKPLVDKITDEFYRLLGSVQSISFESFLKEQL